MGHDSKLTRTTRFVEATSGRLSGCGWKPHLRSAAGCNTSHENAPTRTLFHALETDTVTFSNGWKNQRFRFPMLGKVRLEHVVKQKLAEG